MASLCIGGAENRDKKGTENEGKDCISKEPKSFRGTDLVLSQSQQSGLLRRRVQLEDAVSKIGEPSLCLMDKEALIKAGSMSLKWLPYLAK